MLVYSILCKKEAARLQDTLSNKIIREDRTHEIRLVGGVDIAYVDRYSIGAAVTLDYENMQLVEKKFSYCVTKYSYEPTFLSFREMQPAVAAVKTLLKKPDILLVDGHGIAHPRRFGFASHLGLVLDLPSIGVAKNILCGNISNKMIDCYKPIIHRGELIGASVSTKRGLKPIYVSIGNKISLEKAVEIVLHCTRNCKLPEPVFQAHLFSNKEKKLKRTKLSKLVRDRN